MSIYITCFLGACLQEVLHWVDLKQKLGEEVKITKSIDYWAITLVAIVLFTFATPILVDSFEGSENWHYLVVAFAFPSVLKKLVKVVLGWLPAGDGPRSLTTKSDPAPFKMKDYFKSV
ncbi:hypothetical protein [Aquimarina sp. Aq78]|uniref:hypothetical protein n=1 Tax=Aquimarina sp. Aq78 TaxID=1191889 RepID=UPI000D105B8D|nr:hypothetical protein [Aquimarina sp. Aq78]